ncbi:MAG: RNHCP domain-containing protein [Alphaproteobacteria bacterium]|nr:RNHCP domain-containing protein [Alphaproteobacteria bacterium]
MARNLENTGFICENCNEEILPVNNGRYRNHCPFCLYSVHLDIIPGDRASSCKGLMQPMQLAYKAKKGWQIIHRCLACGAQKTCRIAEDTLQPDSYERLALVSQNLMK